MGVRKYRICMYDNTYLNLYIDIYRYVLLKVAWIRGNDDRVYMTIRITTNDYHHHHGRIGGYADRQFIEMRRRGKQWKQKIFSND